MSRLQTISELYTEIHTLENTVLYCQNRILQKRIAITELFASHPEAVAAEPEPAELDATPTPSVRAMVDEVVAEMNGDEFGLRELRAACVARYPSATAKIKVGIHAACDKLLRRGMVVRTAGGFKRKETS